MFPIFLYLGVPPNEKGWETLNYLKRQHEYSNVPYRLNISIERSTSFAKSYLARGFWERNKNPFIHPLIFAINFSGYESLWYSFAFQSCLFDSSKLSIERLPPPLEKCNRLLYCNSKNLVLSAKTHQNSRKKMAKTCQNVP